MKGRQDYRFSEVPTANIPRSVFSRSHQYKTTLDAGTIYPVYLDEALPGDTFRCNMSMFARLSTPTFPLMDNVYFDVLFFSIPIRQVWDNFRKFCGEQVDPGDSTDFLVPTVDITTATGNLADYFGIPLGGDGTGGTVLTVNALPFRCYNHVFNHWFRSQDLVDSAIVDTDDGPDNQGDYVLRKRMKRHDYFTSALPFPQKGDAVELPLGTTAPVVGVGGAPTWDVGAVTNISLQGTVASSNAAWTAGSTSTTPAVWNDTQLQTDLQSASGATINAMREAFQIQKLLERDARGGTRYAEIVASHFKVQFDDLRYRPLYLGGGTVPIIINPVAATAFSSTSPDHRYPGDLAAFGVAANNNLGFTASFTEHCYILGVVCARADLTYHQGINKMWLRSTRYDFYWPALSHLGEQAIESRELYADGTGSDTDVFGYQERYAEYRYYPSLLTGQFRPNAATNFAEWHLAQEFASRPTLGQTFIEEDVPVDRVVNVASEPHFIFDSWFDIKCARPMPTYAVPGLIDHF